MKVARDGPPVDSYDVAVDNQHSAAARTTGEIPPFLLFPPTAPAGWSWNGDPLPTGLVADPFASEADLYQRARDRVCAIAMDLFAESLAIGLTASEAADVIVRDGAYHRARGELIGRSLADSDPVDPTTGVRTDCAAGEIEPSRSVWLAWHSGRSSRGPEISGC